MSVSVIGLGTWQLGGEWGKSFAQREVDLIFDAARESGMTLVDTAECYGDHLSERHVGAAVKRDRDRWIIATKFGHRFTALFKREERWGAVDVQAQLEASLEALGVQTIDLYQFHSGPNSVFDNEELWSMLARQKTAGKIRHVGISISSGLSAADLQHQAGRAREVGAEVFQVVYNRLQRGPEESILPLAREENIGVLARVPLASGFLSGKYREGAVFAPEDHRSHKSAAEISRTAAEVERIQKEEVPAGVSLASWALAWCLRTPGVAAVIPGCKSAEQVKQNAAAVKLL